MSFDGPDPDDDPTNDPTVVNINSDAAIKVVKTVHDILDNPLGTPDGVLGADDIIVTVLLLRTLVMWKLKTPLQNWQSN